MTASTGSRVLRAQVRVPPLLLTSCVALVKSLPSLCLFVK